MPQSNYVFLSGEPLDVGFHGSTSYVFHSGDPVPNSGKSPYVFESGTGLGGQEAEIEITDSQGSTTGNITLFSRAEQVEDFYDFERIENQYSAATGEINDFLQQRYTTFFVFENTNTGEWSFGFVHDVLTDTDTGNGGIVDFSISNLPTGSSFVVQDDPGEEDDFYNVSGSSAEVRHEWGRVNTDGAVVGRFDPANLNGTTVTFDVTRHEQDQDGDGPPHTIQFVGDGGTTVQRSYDGTNTKVNITFGSV